MNIHIDDKFCWLCGVNNVEGKHHAIPKQFKPRKNIMIPICDKCHLKINKVDIKGLQSYAFRVIKELSQSKNAVSRVTGMLEEYLENKKGGGRKNV